MDRVLAGIGISAVVIAFGGMVAYVAYCIWTIKNGPQMGDPG